MRKPRAVKFLEGHKSQVPTLSDMAERLHKAMGQRIAKLREEAGFESQSALARKIGTSPQTVQQWEAGRTTPRGKNLESLARELHSTEAYIMFGAVGDPERAAAQLEAQKREEIKGRIVALLLKLTSAQLQAVHDSVRDMLRLIGVEAEGEESRKS